MDSFNNSVPTTIAFAKIKDKCLDIYANKKIISIEENIDVFLHILENSNGMNRAIDIINNSVFKKPLIVKIILFLYKNKIIIDTRKIYKFYLDKTNNTDFCISTEDYKLSDDSDYLDGNFHSKTNKTFDKKKYNLFLKKILSNRKSTRSFSKYTGSIDILELLSTMYYINNNYTVPSGGALYEINIYVYIINKYKNNSTGLYVFNPRLQKLIWKKYINLEDITFFNWNRDGYKQLWNDFYHNKYEKRE